MNEIINEIDFYKQRLKEAKSKLYQDLHDTKRESIKILDQKIEKNWAMYHGDCIETLKGIPSNSIHYSIFSPPFSSLFTYSASERDMGNCTDQEFYEHFHFLVPELYRIMMPGRLISIHCSDIPAMKERDGYIGLKDFPGIVLREFERAGFIYHSRVQIKKNELMEAQRTKAIGLAHKQVVKDSAVCRNALPDYIVTIHKPGDNPEPISRPNGFEYYIGTKKQPTQKKNKEHNINRFSQKIWQRYASSVWMDIRQTDTLNVRQARDRDDERHICPTQQDDISRCIHLWSNKGDTVLSPFAGIGSEGDQALRTGRKFIGIELKKSYFDIACRNLEKASKKRMKGFFG